MEICEKILLLNEKGKELLKLKEDYEKIPNGQMKEIAKIGLANSFKGAYTPTIIKSFFDSDYEGFLNKVLGSKNLKRENVDIIKERFNQFLLLDLMKLDSEIQRGYTKSSVSKDIKEILGSQLTSSARKFFISNIQKVQLAEIDGVFYLLKMAGLRYTAFRNFPGIENHGEFYKDTSFMSDFIKNYHINIVDKTLKGSVDISNVIIDDDSLNSKNFKSEIHSAYKFKIAIPLKITDTVDDMVDKVITLNKCLFKLNVL